ncbi:S-adenosylmethionine-dependent methyltransferase [Leptospira ryugenii]|uniref:Ribosomal RNA small subunit methyltransferase H n=1 Tax=Leptospira ryugenii TaxID=1917863 RepID=A0A2P2DWZ2_9LEPT|nr:16S rRNA (cytosine(1402)-N(4))-methyltransferase RsmH [Leptospira ryugenii]GBF49151.1 S-adenosylmethionine-dependent methyltransferase [Leptospira ryugenii]
MIVSPHIPVLPSEVIQLAKIGNPTWILDATAGEGGHSSLLLDTFPEANLVMVDRDAVMLERAKKTMEGRGKVFPIRSNFSEIDRECLEEIGCPGLDFVLIDLGVSLYHFLHSGRGFTLKQEEPLDMRLEPQIGNRTAADIVNFSSVLELKRIFQEYGEERWALRIANQIIETRKKKKFTQNQEIVKLVESSIPRKFWPKDTHPATRIFQALRIEVNQELEHAEKGIRNLSGLLQENGIMACISFHSLEDRIVKWTFRDLQASGSFTVLTKKPLIPTDAEIRQNRASRSAKLRGIQKNVPIMCEDEES